MVSYTLIQEPDKTDIHRFKLIDGSATIEVVETRKSIYYNVFRWGILENKELDHDKFTINYYDMNDGSPFGILVYRANEMYLELLNG